MKCKSADISRLLLVDVDVADVSANEVIQEFLGHVLGVNRHARVVLDLHSVFVGLGGLKQKTYGCTAQIIVVFCLKRRKSPLDFYVFVLAIYTSAILVSI